MILLIDIGNTRVKWRCMEEGKFSCGGHQAHEGNFSPALLHRIWGGLNTPSSVWVVNVAGAQIAEQISQWSTTRWGQVPHFVTASAHMGNVTNGYREPEKLGADRWMALIGADRIMKGACCVADCGSAVTIDCMNRAHDHVGGLILPGLTMMPRCVSSNTAQVPLMAGEPDLLGRDTASCLASGATQSIVATLRRMAEVMEKQLSSPISCIITGGDAEHLLPWLGQEWHYEPDLIFIGLAAAMRYQQD